MADLILASRSPRRAELLKQLHLAFKSVSGDVLETIDDGEEARHYVSRMALTKVLAVEVGQSELPILAADTVVVLNNEILGKPKDERDGMNMLMKLSARTHSVFTGVTLKQGDQLETFVTESLVSFRKLSAEECRNYWQSGEPTDKAGAYGIQGLGAIFVSSITGSYSNVVGLPLMETALVLRRFGINCLVN